MRAIVITGLLLGLCAAAEAATRDKLRPYGAHRPLAAVRSGADRAVPPGWYKFPGYPPIPPEQNRNLDPSNFGGG